MNLPVLIYLFLIFFIFGEILTTVHFIVHFFSAEAIRCSYRHRREGGCGVGVGPVGVVVSGWFKSAVKYMVLRFKCYRSNV